MRARALLRSASRWASTLTREQPSYRHIARGDYGTVTPDDVSALQAVVSSRVLGAGDEGAGAFNEDWLGQYRGSAAAVVRPRTTAEAAAVLAYCNDRRIAVNLQGGNTGLVGGSVPVHDEVVVSTVLMNEVHGLDEASGVLTCQAGCVLERLDGYAAERGFMMPLDLGAKGSCQIGGNVATNAGGIRLLRYGSLHGTVLGLEAVLPDGTVLDTLSGIRKDNTGYDLKQLFIGSEGTLGLVTAVSILCAPQPKAVNLAFLGCESWDAVLRTAATAREHLSEVLSALEFLDAPAMRCSERGLGLKNPISDQPFYVLVETHGSNDDHDSEKLNGFLEAAMESGHVVDGTVAQDRTQLNKIWHLRESLASALKEDGHVYKYDVSLPTTKLYELVEEVQARLGDSAITCAGYGHLGDGNLHLNVTSPTACPEVLAAIEPFVYEYTSAQGGSISAEHGLGVMKAAKLHYSKSPAAIEVMRALKSTLDPNGILNPYKVLPPPN